MKEFYDFRKIEKTKNRDQILFQILESGDFNKFVNISKATGAIFSPFSRGSENDKFIEKASQYIEMNIGGNDLEEWNDICNTKDILSDMYKKIFSSNDFREASSIEPQDELSLLLISSEIIVRYMLNLKNNNEESNAEIMKHFSFDHLLESIRNKEDVYKGKVMYENAANCAASLLKNSLFKNTNKKQITMEFNKEYRLVDVDLAIKHHISVDKYRFISQLTDEFRYSELIANKVPNRDFIQFKNLDDKFRDSFEVYRGRINTINSQHEAEFMRYINRLTSRVDSNTADFPPVSGRNISELFSYTGLCYRLFVDNLNVVGKITRPRQIDVSILSLLRAYTILSQICEEHIISSTLDMNKLSVMSTCKVISFLELKKKLIDGGINDKECNEIIDILTFNEKSDLNDCPLIKHKDNYIIIPSICSQTIGYLAVLSRVDQFEFQGNAFENKLINSFSRAKIHAINKKSRKNNEEYQCDLMFVLKDELYICECKAWGEVSTMRGYYEQFLKKKNACNQLNRIANFYNDNVSLITCDLNLPDNWRPKEVHRILIISNMIGDVEKIDGISIIDYSYMAKFLKRDKPKLLLSHNKAIELKGFEVFDRNITLRRMKKFINSNIPIRLQKARLEKDEEQIEVFDQIIKFDVYNEKFSNYYITDKLDEHSINAYIKSIERLGLI